MSDKYDRYNETPLIENIFNIMDISREIILYAVKHNIVETKWSDASLNRVINNHFDIILGNNHNKNKKIDKSALINECKYSNLSKRKKSKDIVSLFNSEAAFFREYSDNIKIHINNKNRKLSTQEKVMKSYELMEEFNFDGKPQNALSRLITLRRRLTTILIGDYTLLSFLNDLKSFLVSLGNLIGGKLKEALEGINEILDFIIDKFSNK